MKGFVVIVCVALCGLAECDDVPGISALLESAMTTDKLKLLRVEPFITPCREQDLVCLKHSAQAAVPLLAAGVPSMGVAVMDPMFVEQVKTTHAGLQMDFRNTTVTGLRHCKVESLERHEHITKLILKCSVIMKGDYTLGGKLLIMPIQGDGKYTIKIHDIVVKIQFHIVDTEKDGDVYWMVKDWQYSSEVEKGVHFRFNNLFNGNKLLSDAVHTFANSNWRGIFAEVAPPIVKAIVSKLVVESTKLFGIVPVKKLVIE